MEQHPVPQNIIGFQFKLIGDMTVRQFLYLAGGVLTGYVILQLGWPAIIKWPLAFLFGGGGFAFAFIPIEERPLDRWLISFFQRVYSPTQFLWKKRALPPEILTAPVLVAPLPTQEMLKKEKTAVKVEEYLLTLPAAPATTGELDKQEASFLTQVASFFAPSSPTRALLAETPAPPTTSQSASPIPPVPLPAEALAKAGPIQTPPSPRPSNPDLNQQTENLTSKITALQRELASQTITKTRFLEIQSQLTNLLAEKERLTQELTELRKKLAEMPVVVTRPTAMAQAPEKPTVKIITPGIAPKIGMPKPPTLPNIISGIVKTQKGLILPGILVEIRNQEGTPARALKTGKLGQFAISTPLVNGIYTLHLEDPQKKFYFEVIEITLEGKLVAPLEILAKTEKDRVKEELRKKLFGQDKF